jgi:hypothetical protein
MKQNNQPTPPLSVQHLPARVLGASAFLVSSAAYAASTSIGGGLITYAQPIILFLGVGAVVVALVGAVFRPELVKGAVWAAVILVVVFFVLRNAAALQSAVQAG